MRETPYVASGWSRTKDSPALASPVLALKFRGVSPGPGFFTFFFLLHFLLSSEAVAGLEVGTKFFLQLLFCLNFALSEISFGDNPTLTIIFIYVYKV